MLRELAIVFAVSTGLSSSSQIDCPFEKMDWMEQSENYSTKEFTEFTSKIVKSLNIDKNSIQGSKFSNEFIELLNTALSSNRKYKVSQKFFETYKKHLNSICNLNSLLNNKSLNAEQRTRIVDMILDMEESFNSIDSTERRLPELVVEKITKTKVLFSVTNYTQTRYPVSISEIYVESNGYYNKHPGNSVVEFTERMPLYSFKPNSDTTVTYNLLMDSTKTVVIPAKGLASFFFSYTYPVFYRDDHVHRRLVIKFINPIDSEMSEISKPLVLLRP